MKTPMPKNTAPFYAEVLYTVDKETAVTNATSYYIHFILVLKIQVQYILYSVMYNLVICTEVN